MARREAEEYGASSERRATQPGWMDRPLDEAIYSEGVPKVKR